MSSQNLINKKSQQGDPLYNNRQVAQLINRVMRSGKKNAAQKQVYNAFIKISQTGGDPQDIFQKALNNVSPKFEVRAKRVGGASYQVPTEVSGNRKISLAIRWIIKAASSKSNKEYHSFGDKLAAELIDAAKGEGEAVKKRETTHKMAEANRVFSHFRW